MWLQVGSHSLLLSLLPQDQVIKAKAGKWKQESNQFREAMKAARQASLAEKTGDMSLMPAHVPSGPDPSLVQCPHCFRRFNETAAERHIPKCQDIKAKPRSLKRGAGRGASGGLGGSSRSRR